MTRDAEANESTALLAQSEVMDESSSTAPRGQARATFFATVANSMKTCMGTGTLALPFAAQQGGLLLNTVGLLGIAAWNLYSVQRLIQSLRLVKSDETTTPPVVTSTFGRVAWLAFGEKGVHGLDVALVILFLGIIVAYEDGILGFMQDTPLHTGIAMVDAFGIAAIVGTLSLVPDMGYLSKISASGLTVLALTFVTIAGYAVAFPSEHGTTHDSSYQPLQLWPENGLSGVSRWFGCVVFGFGVVPLTYNFYESMAQPQELVKASVVALIGTACSYMMIGCGLLTLYYPVNGDILEKLPTVGVVPLVIRVAMIVVVLFTAPLIVLPCGLILEGKLLSSSRKTTQAIVRYAICIVCAMTSVVIPGFVNVLSFVGCFSVALVSFVFPPLIHISLLLRTKGDTSSRDATGTTTHASSAITADLMLDAAMLIWGIAATVISSIYTFRKLFDRAS